MTCQCSCLFSTTKNLRRWSSSHDGTASHHGPACLPTSEPIILSSPNFFPTLAGLLSSGAHVRVVGLRWPHSRMGERGRRPQLLPLPSMPSLLPPACSSPVPGPALEGGDLEQRTLVLVGGASPPTPFSLHSRSTLTVVAAAKAQFPAANRLRGSRQRSRGAPS